MQHRFEDGYAPSDLDNLTLEFRRRSQTASVKKEYQHVGSLQVDANTSGLRLERSAEIIAASGDSSEKVLAHFRSLVGKTLLEIGVTSGGDTRFGFDDGLLPRCFAATTKVGDIWRISSEDSGDNVVMGPGGRWSYSGTVR